MRFGLSDNDIKQINRIFNQYPEIEKVIIYGSRAKGNFRDGSDIDLTLIGEGVNLSMLLKIEEEIDDLLLPYTTDLSIFPKIDNPDLIDHINRVGNIFYKNPSSKSNK